MVQESLTSRQRESTFTITAGAKKNQTHFYLQRENKIGNQEQTPHYCDTLKINAANDNGYLQSVRLEIGKGTYYPALV